MRETVLIVDDSPTIRGIARIFLKALAVEIQEAEEGERALEMVRSAPPALVVVAVNMPGMDGLAFTRALRADASPAVAAVPVVILTGDRSESMREQGRAAGASGFLEKPIKGPELQETVRKFLRPAL